MIQVGNLPTPFVFLLRNIRSEKERKQLKGAGYLISIVSVILLGIVAWPKPDEPQWKGAIVIAGMLASVVGMALRYLSHLREKREIERAQS